MARDRRSELLEFGLRVFGNRSYAEISIDEIAEGAEVSRGLLYHYFGNKRGYYVATVRFAAERMTSLMSVEGATTPIDMLRAALRQYLDYIEDYADAYITLLRGGVGADPEILEILESTRRTNMERLVTGLGLSVAGDPQLIATMRGWFYFVEGTSLDWLAVQGLEKDELVALWMKALWALLAERLTPR